VGHTLHIKAWIPPLGTNTWAGTTVVNLQVGLENTSNRGKPGAERKEGDYLQDLGDALGFRERTDASSFHILEP